MPTGDAQVTPAGLRPIYEAARLRLARMRVDGSTTLTTAMEKATELSARILNVARVGIWLFNESRDGIECLDLYQLAGDRHEHGRKLESREFPAYFAALEERREIAAHDAQAHPMTRELAANYLAPLGITSMLDAPIFRDGSVAGVVCHEHIGQARKWTREERDFAGTVADMITIMLEEAARHDAEASVTALTERLAESRKLEALGRLAAGVAHDFRSFLTPVVALAERIATNPRIPAEVTSQAERILDAARRASGLAEQLLLFGRQAPESKSETNVGAAISALAHTLEVTVGAKHKVVLECSTTSLRCAMEQALLDQIVMNLIVNAKEAMPRGGDIELAVGSTKVEIADAKPQTFVTIRVSDTGTGMDEGVRARLFEPFFTTKLTGQGHGLGLAIVYRIVSTHGGWVDVETTPGRGSTFRVFLPHAGSHPETRGAIPPARQPML